MKVFNGQSAFHCDDALLETFIKGLIDLLVTFL